MTEVLFYHLERARLEDVLPQLVQKTLQRGWKAVVQTVDPGRLKFLSEQFWQWRDDEFLAHGSEDDGNAQLQPVWLTTSDENPNDSNIRFLVDGAQFDNPAGLDRLIILFDGNDDGALAAARERWKSVSSQGLTATYWQQDERGGWVKKAESGSRQAQQKSDPG
ncbi:DNA polymerase III subunit chi [Anderseniella sp. Alg231-50]|uniref:DNA polymerase III subunit chi n=1 Tax=Anderseniella sp. Alg231-50 TaxID=1922226 RepID=UPI000D5560A1